MFTMLIAYSNPAAPVVRRPARPTVAAKVEVTAEPTKRATVIAGTKMIEPQLPTPERLPAWRAACLAYREQRRAGAGDLVAWSAAVAALQAVWPLPDKEARLEATNAIAYAADQHTKWFWSGVGGRG